VSVHDPLLSLIAWVARHSYEDHHHDDDGDSLREMAANARARMDKDRAELTKWRTANMSDHFANGHYDQACEERDAWKARAEKAEADLKWVLMKIGALDRRLDALLASRTQAAGVCACDQHQIRQGHVESCPFAVPRI
jgi:hypothetical protein